MAREGVGDDLVAALERHGSGGDQLQSHYATSLQHVLAEIERIDLLIQAQVQRARQVQVLDHELPGLYLSSQEIDALLARPIGLPLWAAEATSLNLGDFRAGLEGLSAAILRRREASRRQGIKLRLDELARLFCLSPFERDALLVCLAPEIDLRYESLYAYLQDDVTKKRPSVDLVLNLLCSSLEIKLAARQRFSADTPLIHWRLLHLFDDPSEQPPPLLRKRLKVDDRIVSYLLDSDTPDTGISPNSRLVAPRAQWRDLLLPEDLKRRLPALVQGRGSDGAKALFYFQGPSGTGKRTAAEALCREQGLKLLLVRGARLWEEKPLEIETRVRLLQREALLQDAALYVNDFDLLLADDRQASLEALVRQLIAWPGLTFVAGDNAWEPAGTLRDIPWVRIIFAPLAYADRVQLWARSLSDHACGLDLEPLANKFRFNGGQIQDVIATAENLAYGRNPPDGQVTTDDLQAACRLQSNRKLATLAKKVVPRYRWEDIVLPPGQLEQLRAIARYVKHRALIYDDWGFDRKLALGKGMNALFAGPSGAGKTMAADTIAHDLGLDLYRIDLAAVVSKYIGETEKNLARIFSEAATSNAILFFDEADALFGKRSEVKDSHDRYANIEISYLLQKMDEYEGVTILATNLRKNMDDAFLRRLAVTVQFPMPDEAGRRRIWQQIWPQTVPLDHNLDLDFMAAQFKLTGGNIKNIALAAAFLAAEEGLGIGMAHLMQATKQELQKMGKTCVAGDFGPYYALLEGQRQ